MSDADEPDVNPYAAPISIPAKRKHWDGGVIREGVAYRAATLLAACLMIGSPIAAAFAVFDIETIVGSGPTLLSFAIVLVILARRVRAPQLIWLSLAVIAMVVGCFFTIFFLEWNPADAQFPIGTATVVFAAVIQIGWMGLRQLSKERFELSLRAGNA